MTRKIRIALVATVAIVAGLLGALATGVFDGVLQTALAPSRTETPGSTDIAALPLTTAGEDAAREQVIPIFDLVRVEPTGDAVIAGQGAPNAAVEILSGGGVIATGKANATGEWAIVLKDPLDAGAHDITVRSTGSDGTQLTSEQSVAVSVPEGGEGEVLVVLNQPGTASTILQVPGQAETEEAIAEAAAAGQPTEVAAAPDAAAQQPPEPAADPVEVAAATPDAPVSSGVEASAVLEGATAAGDGVEDPATPAPAATTPDGSTPSTAVAALDPSTTEPIRSDAGMEGQAGVPASPAVDATAVSPATGVEATIEVAPSGAAPDAAPADVAAQATDGTEPALSAAPTEQAAMPAGGEATTPIAGSPEPTQPAPANGVEIAAAPGAATGAPADGDRTAPGPDVAGQDAAGQVTTGPDTAGQDTPVPDVAGQDAAGQVTTGPDTAGQDTPVPDAAGQQVAAVSPSEPSTPAPDATDQGASAAADPAAGEPSPAPAPAPAQIPITIEAVELENGEQFFAAGAAQPGAKVRLYVNDSLAGETTAMSTGRWLIDKQHPLDPGSHTVRVDRLAPDGSVIARAEVPFEIVEELQAALTGASGSGSLGAGTGIAGEARVGDAQTLIIRRGDNLWRIARRLYGRGTRYSTIYEANTDQIVNPDLIFPGQVFVIPESDRNWEPVEALSAAPAGGAATTVE